MENLDLARNILPENFQTEQYSESIFKASTQNNSNLFISIGKAKGYEGPIQLALISDSSGQIIDVSIIGHTETPSYFNKVIKAKFTDQFFHQPIHDILQYKNMPDAVSGATYTSLGISNAVYDASVSLAEEIYNIPIPVKKKEVFQISFLDVLLLLFFIAVMVSRKLKPKQKRWARYAMLLLAVISLGFTYNFHLSISRFNALILGYWPDINIHLAWYILVFGVIILTALNGRNPYCQWFCPFGAVQEGIGKIGKIQFRVSRSYRKTLVWVPRILAWLAIVVALIYRNPGLTSYEVFGKFFTLTGSDLLFALTLLILIFSLFINRPWCKYLCPVPPVLDYLIYMRNQIQLLWQVKR